VEEKIKLETTIIRFYINFPLSNSVDWINNRRISNDTYILFKQRKLFILRHLMESKTRLDTTTIIRLNKNFAAINFVRVRRCSIEIVFRGARAI